MRSGRPEDLLTLTRLWEQEALAGLRDSAPPEPVVRRAMASFDWSACSRVDEVKGEARGMVIVTRREFEGQTFSRVEAAYLPAAGEEVLRSLLTWGLGLSRAAGADVVSVWRARDTAQWLTELGLRPVRPWWRMDRSLDGALPAPVPVPGYHLLDGANVSPTTWADAYNRSFADHWRHVPRSPEELEVGRLPALELMAAGERGEPAAITLCTIERYGVDARPQPVGIVGSVGTLPAHRRRGLASWLVAEALGRLKAAGAASASLYVDGKNEHRAAELYSRFGFVVTFDTTVWEATFP